MDVYKDPTKYHHHCAELQHGVYFARDVFRCQHFKKWFPILQANNYREFLTLGFEDWVPFTKHHTMRDNVATNRSLGRPRIYCESDEPCRHIGHQPQYPWLGNAASRRRRCFRVLPSASRFDITQDIQSDVRLGEDVATWTPLMVMLFSLRDPQNEAQDTVRKKKRRRTRYEISVPLKWDQEMKRTLERVELLELAFNDDRHEMDFICQEFGNFSVEASALRTIRKLVAPPEIIKPGSTRAYGTWPFRGEPAPARNKADGEPNEAGDAATDSAAGQDDTEPTLSTTEILFIESVGEEGEKDEDTENTEPDSNPVEDPSVNLAIASTEKTASVSSRSEEESSEDEELLPPPIKRRRYSPPAHEFPYTRKPHPTALGRWREDWELFYKAQQKLRRGPGAGLGDSMGSTIPLPPKGSKRAHRRNASADDEVSSDGSTDEDEKIDRDTRRAMNKVEWGESYPPDFTFGTSKDARRTQRRATENEAK